MHEVRYISGRKYEKELSKAEEIFLDELDSMGFEYRLSHHENYKPVYRISKGGVSILVKLWTHPKYDVHRQIDDAMKMYNMKVKVLELKEKGEI